jgi:hypothetical protein
LVPLRNIQCLRKPLPALPKFLTLLPGIQQIAIESFRERLAPAIRRGVAQPLLDNVGRSIKLARLFQELQLLLDGGPISIKSRDTEPRRV